jgi:hypothetical protein
MRFGTSFVFTCVLEPFRGLDVSSSRVFRGAPTLLADTVVAKSKMAVIISFLICLIYREKHPFLRC